MKENDEIARFERFVAERQDAREPREPHPRAETKRFDEILDKAGAPELQNDPEWAKFQSFLREQTRGAGENGSGRGAESILPHELRGLNWGAAIWSVIWGGAMKVPAGTLLAWFLLLMVIPIFPLYLLFKGNEIAWRNRKWSSIEEFLESQRKWTISGLVAVGLIILILVSIGMMIGHLLGPVLRGGGLFQGI